MNAREDLIANGGLEEAGAGSSVSTGTGSHSTFSAIADWMVGGPIRRGCNLIIELRLLTSHALRQKFHRTPALRIANQFIR
jgi:hypothetical protein